MNLKYKNNVHKNNNNNIASVYLLFFNTLFMKTKTLQPTT